MSIKDYDKRVSSEISRVRNLTAGGKDWVVLERDGVNFYEDESVTALTDVADVTARKLATFEISTVREIRALTDDRITAICTSTDENQKANPDRLTRKALSKFREQARTGILIPGPPPS